GPIMVMLREHGELWNLLVTIESAIAEDQPAPKIAGSWQQLETTLTEHNFKEERILYPAGDEALTDDESGQVRSELAEGVLPQGWVCQMAAGS
ncbi:MAG: hemerythrin domain-containing protein, partial [Nocardioidaceae bacterium]|nr:hemerythrin domain-containing protein [Nocardioidaceae bacterium]